MEDKDRQKTDKTTEDITQVNTPGNTSRNTPGNAPDNAGADGSDATDTDDELWGDDFGSSQGSTGITADADTGAGAGGAGAGAGADSAPGSDVTVAEATAGGKGRKKHSVLGIVLDVVLAILIVLIVLIIVFSVCFQGIYIVGTSMEPTFTGATDEDTIGGDYVYANVYAKPTYGDVVIVYNQYNSKNIIKRVIALEGDTLYIESGTVYIEYAGTDEFVALEEDYVDPANNRSNKSYEAHTVGEGGVYCLGDNRDVSNDSRAYGDFLLSNVLGVVPGWAISIKGFTTSIYDAFHF